MGSTIHAKISGVKGESQDTGFTGEIDIESYSFSASNPPSDTGGGLSKGKARPSDFGFSIMPGESSTKLFDFLNKGQHIDEVVVSFSKTSGEGQQSVYKTMKFKNCFMSSYSEGGSDNNADQPEHFSLAFTAIEKEYKAQATAGGGLSNAANAKWDYQKSSEA